MHGETVKLERKLQFRSVPFSSVQFSYVPNTGTRNVEQVSLSSRSSVTMGPESVTCSFLSLDPSVDGRLAPIPILPWH